ncbi:Leucine-rich repeat-containing protein sog2, partial [Tolypocladium capitatum]
LCDLQSLEILDLGHNELRVLPEEIARLSSLKVLSVPDNQIRKLPLCLADMYPLQVLKFEGNPISFPPKDIIIHLQAGGQHNGALRDGEVAEIAATAHIKKIVRHYAINRRVELRATGDELSAGTETPRLPLRRAATGRFPVKVNGADFPSVRRSPNSSQRLPPMPTESHHRVLSQQNTAIRRPGAMPLTIGNVNERLRSNSETLFRSNKTDGRSRRIGIVSRKTSELGTLDESQADVQFSHHRGLSYGSAVKGTPRGVKSPTISTQAYLQRPVYVRWLSILPERRRESTIVDPVIEAAKGILYSAFQIHPTIQALLMLANRRSGKRSSLEIVFYNTNSHVEELEQEIEKYDSASIKDDNLSSHNENVYRACQTLVSAYGHVCALLANNVDSFVDDGDQRYIRSFLMLLYHSTMELCVTLSSLATKCLQHLKATVLADSNETIRPYFREACASITFENPGVPACRNRTLMHDTKNLRFTPSADIPSTKCTKRSAAITLASPRSGEALAALGIRKLRSELRQKTRTLARFPPFRAQLTGGFRNAPAHCREDWGRLIVMCTGTITQTEAVEKMLFVIKREDSNAGSQASFWDTCVNFIESWIWSSESANSLHTLNYAI